MTLNLNNCILFAATIDQFYHFILLGCLELAKYTAEAIPKVNHYAAQKELRFVLRLYYMLG